MGHSEELHDKGKIYLKAIENPRRSIETKMILLKFRQLVPGIQQQNPKSDSTIEQLDAGMDFLAL